MERILLRPVIHWKRVARSIIARVSVSLVISVLLWFLARQFIYKEASPLIYLVGIILIQLMIHRVRITVFFVRIYQRYAPVEMRLACRYVPSCSEYMILSVEKYGFCRGVWKGLRRIIRCKSPNGGIDYP